MDLVGVLRCVPLHASHAALLEFVFGRIISQAFAPGPRHRCSASYRISTRTRRRPEQRTQLKGKVLQRRRTNPSNFRRELDGGADTAECPGWIIQEHRGIRAVDERSADFAVNLPPDFKYTVSRVDCLRSRPMERQRHAGFLLQVNH